MGGYINVAIRFKSGETICQERWTNTMPRWFKNDKMFDGDEDHVRAYVNAVKNNDHVLDHGLLGKPRSVQNGEYGLIVWDFLTGHILDNNGYSDPVSFDILAIVSRDGKSNIGFNEDDMRAKNFVDCAKKGRIRARTRIWKRGQKEDTVEETLTDVLTFEEALEIAKAEYIREYTSDYRPRAIIKDVDFVIDPSPMTYIQFPEGESMRPKLKELGFPLTKAQGLNKTYSIITKSDPSKEEIVARIKYGKERDQNPVYDGVDFDLIDKADRQARMDQAKEDVAYADRLGIGFEKFIKALI